MKLWLAKVSRGDRIGLVPTDAESQSAISRLGDGECRMFEEVRVRDLRSHKRYWLIMTRIAEHVDSIEIDDGVWMPIRSKEDVHTAMKLITGLYDTLPVAGTNYAVRIPKSTDFARMTPDEWEEFLPRVLDAVHAKILPHVPIPSVEHDLARLAS